MSVRAKGFSLLLVSGLLLVGVPAEAKPPAKPGAVTNLALSATKSGSTYAVKATWSAGSNATSYAVRLTKAGVTLDSATVSTLTWTGHSASLSDGNTVSVSVTSVNGNRKSQARTASLVLPDLTAPVASYSVAHTPVNVGHDVTVTSSGLSDNMTPTASIEQTINWGDGTLPEPWTPTVTSINHSYPDLEARYEATVTLKDLAGNTRVHPVVIVVKDTAAPTGSFALGVPKAWAGWTKVSLELAALHDNLSPNDKIARVVSWGDGAQTVWTEGSSPTHVYAAAGSYSPTVQLTDEAGNVSDPVATSTVVVSNDTVAPTLRVKTSRPKRSVRGWRTVKGTATDAGVGVRSVSVRAVEKRTTGWYAYKASTRRWVKAGSKAGAWRKATDVSLRPASTGVWTVKLARLTKGTLLVRSRATDNRGNATGWLQRRAVLTQR